MTKKLEKPCNICRGRQTTTCMICGWKRKGGKTNKQKKAEEPTKEENYKAWLGELHGSLKRFNQISTGIPSLDQDVREQVGEWRQ